MTLPPRRRRNAFRRGSGLGLIFSAPELVSVFMFFASSSPYFSSCAREYSRAGSTASPHLLAQKCAGGTDDVVLSTTVSEGWRKNAATAGRKNEFRIPDLDASGIQVGATWHTLCRAQ